MATVGSAEAGAGRRAAGGGWAARDPTGAHWLDTNFDRRVWKRARDEAGLPDLTFHTLRYFYVSHVRAQGLASALTEQLVGHVDERTHQGYTRPIAGTEPVIRAALTAAFGGDA